MAKGDHVVMGNESGPCGYCPHCGDTFPIPIGDLGWAVAVMRAFGKAHRNCKPGTVRGHRLCGLQAVDGLHPGIPLEKEQPCPKP